MRVKFRPVDERAPEGKLAEVELHFDEGIFEDMKLIGFSLWRSKKSKSRPLYLLPPSRRWKDRDGNWQSYDFLRPCDSDNGHAGEELESRVIEEYQKYEEKRARQLED